MSAAGVSTGGLLLTASAVAAFLAHEPATILLGLRGARAERQLRGAAILWLACCGGIGIVAGTIALFTVARETAWSIAVPVVPAGLLAVATVRGHEKSGYGEVSAALAFAGLPVPVTMAAGASLKTAAAVAVPFALLFVTSTLAVRSVILRVRGGGDARAALTSRRWAVAVTGVGTACLVWLTRVEALPSWTLAAAAPSILAALVMTTRPPHPSRVRTVGWTLIAVSVLTSAIVIAATRINPAAR